ncbi:MAG: hypothetical protein ACERKD_20590 [Prolixibacteraceae bacterium]
MGILQVILLGYSLFIFENTIDLRQGNQDHIQEKFALSAPLLPMQVALKISSETTLPIVIHAVSKKMVSKGSDELLSDTEVHEQLFLEKIPKVTIHLIILLLNSP